MWAPNNISVIDEIYVALPFDVYSIQLKKDTSECFCLVLSGIWGIFVLYTVCGLQYVSRELHSKFAAALVIW